MGGDGCYVLNQRSAESIENLKLLVAISRYTIIVLINSWASLSHMKEMKQ